MQKISSILDYPKKGLDPTIWDTSGEIKLQPEVRSQIEDIVFSALDDLDLPDSAVTDLLIYGSILTNQWRKSTDIDARIILDPEIIKERFKSDITGDALFDMVQEQIHNVEIKGTKHPFNATIIIDGEDTELGKAPLGKTEKDPVYDVLNEKIIVPPDMEDESFDPDIEFSKERDEADQIMEKLDALLRNTKNDLIDYDILKEAIEDVRNPDAIVKKLEKKVSEIEMDIKKVISEYNEIKTERTKDLNKSNNPSRHKTPGNVRFKILEKYQYLDILRKIKKILKGGLEEEELPELAKVVNIAKKIRQ